MGLKNIPLKSTYDSDEDDIIDSFYVPALSESTSYKRLAGFFSSTTLAVAARGIYNFIINGGKMDLLVSANLTKLDVEAISNGLADLPRLIERKAVEDLSNLSVDFMRDHVRALGWMVAHDKLRIKIVIPCTEDGRPLNVDEIEKSGIFHQKVGILEDANGDRLSFSGSVNETAYGWTHNIEEFKVFKGWESSNEPWFSEDERKFKKYWNGEAQNARTFVISEAIRREMVSISPASVEEMDLLPPRKSTRITSESQEIRRGQQKAIERWKRSNLKGILSMATGTGKTLVALMAVRKYVSPNAIVVVAVPSVALVTQWKREIFRVFPDSVIIECDSVRPSWHGSLKTAVDYLALNEENNKRVFAVTTYQTGRTAEFGKLLDTLPAEKLCLVADEVHHVGAPNFSRILGRDFRYRLGLSATPERMWDEEGQQKTTDFFGPVVFEYSLPDALKDKRLSEYVYHIVTINLTDAELRQYLDSTRAISASIAKALKSHPSLKHLPFPKLMAELGKSDEDEFYQLQALILRRANILKRAKNKKLALQNITKETRLGRCLVYCNDLEHADETAKTLLSLGLSPLRYDSTLDEQQRRTNLAYFESAPEGYLVAIKCLDEGVDIPSCDTAILLSSSKSTREFIQRRGRLLRKHEGKEIATIYDIVVLPVDPGTNRAISPLEFSMIDSELQRVRTFAESARNGSEVILQVARLESDLSSKVRGAAE